MINFQKILITLKEGGISFFIKKMVHSILSNSEIYRRIIYRQLDKEYDINEFIIPTYKKINTDSIKTSCNYVWILWLQGIENAPPLVKKCYESVQKYIFNKDIIVINKENLRTYVDIPEYIYEKYNNGIIPPAHFSDIVRTACLIKHGGLWLDSTVLLTDNIPEYYFSEDLFVLQNNEDQIIKCSSWLIYTKESNNPLLYSLYLFLLKYWKTNNKLKHYFLYHLMFSLLINKTPDFLALWKKMHKVSNKPSHKLQMLLLKDFNKAEMNKILSLTQIHKLTYKIPNNFIEKKNSVYYHIIKGKEKL